MPSDHATCHGPTITPHDRAMISTDPMRRAMAHGLALLASIIQATVSVFFTLNPRSVPSDAVVLGSVDAGTAGLRLYLDYLREIEPLDPLAPRNLADTATSVLTSAGLDVDAKALERSAHGRWMRRREIRCVAALYLHEGGRIVAGVYLMRRLELPAFSGGEVLLLRRAQPVLELAYIGARVHSDRPRLDPLATGGLTRRQIAVAQLAATGASNAEIARALYISPATVKTHLTAVYAKLGVRSRMQLADRLRRSITKSAHHR